MKSLPQPTEFKAAKRIAKTERIWKLMTIGKEALTDTSPKNRNFAYTDDGTGLRSEREIVYYFWLWNYK